MKMTWRWYGEGNDQIKLSDIKQIPGVEGIVWALHDKMPGEIWPSEEIAAVKKQLDEYGFNMDVVESVNVHDDIKIGLPTRDALIENYKQTIRCNAIAPGFLVSNQNRRLLFNEDGTPTARSAKILNGTPMGRYVESEELLGAVFFLCDDKAASAITGVVLPIDAGFAAYSGV